MEKWKIITEFNQYEVSNYGNIRHVVNKNNISLQKDKKGYLKCKFYNKENKNYKTIKIHTLVAQYFLNHKTNGTLKLVIDHIDNNKSNNNFTNLQIITNRENCSKDKINKTSKYVGVSYDKYRNKWSAEIRENKKRHKLGRFENEYDAHLAYQNKLKEINNVKL
jgi:hypothetical protein